MRKWIILALLIIAGAGIGGWYWQRGNKTTVVLRTVPVGRGDLMATITATGTLEPEEVVDVGAQVAGMLDYFGKDSHQPGKLIDYGSQVDEGTVLAHIDDSLYVADVANFQAQVDESKANIQKAQADLGQLKAKLHQAENDWKRAQEAGIKAGLSASDLDSYEANYEVAQANVADGDAAILQAQTGLQAAQAALDKAKRNLGYCTITSPVKGTIIDRRVNTGQTVVAALNAPSLFLIAKDLKRMQLWASVNEADIGEIHPGQTVDFSVDPFPNQTFLGTVGQVRLNASMTQNVVTYTVEVNLDNSDGKLLPYLTATAHFELEKRTDVLMVPNATLRWAPQDNQIAPDARQPAGDEGGGPGHSPTSRPAGGPAHQHGTIWVQDGQFVRPVRVRVGLTDGLNTEVEATDLKEGMPIVIGEILPGEGGPAGRNPFVPQFGGGGGRRPR